MLLHPTHSKPPLCRQHVSLSVNGSYSLPFPPAGISNSPLVLNVTDQKQSIIRCSISQVHSYGTVDFERRPMIKWSSVYKRISMTADPKLGAASVLDQFEKEGKRLTKWELSRVMKELRKFRRYKLALEVYEWMNNRGERFRISTSDIAIQLDLISKVHGISRAENLFLKLPDNIKDKRTYGALLNAYARARMRERAESLIDQMRNRGYTNLALPFNVMMTLYMKLKEYNSIDTMVSEMMEKNIPLDIYSYNIWISACGSEGSAEKMEQVFERMKLDMDINPNWSTFSTMATMYLKMGQLEKAEHSLKMVESRITGRNRIPYHYLMSLYSSVGIKEEVYRIWNIYKSVFPFITNLGYQSVISSLVRLDDIEGAEKIYEEWLSVKQAYDPRIGNLIMGWYVRKGYLEKVKAFYEQMIEVGGKPNSTTWEILAEGHIMGRKISEALSCMKEAVSAEGSVSWRPKPVNVSSILKLCEQDDDAAGKDIMWDVLSQVGCLGDEAYMSYIRTPNGTATSSEPAMEKVTADDDNEDDDELNDDGAGMLLNQLQESL